MNELKKVTALAAAFLSVSCTFASEDSQSNTTHIIASRGVDYASHVSTESDGKAALLYDYNDMVIVDLGFTVPKGGSYRINWKKKSTSENRSLATLKVLESSSKSNFSPQKNLPQTAESRKFIESKFIARVATRYIMINVASPIEDAIEIDAVSSFETRTSSEHVPSKNNSYNSNSSEVRNTKSNTQKNELVYNNSIQQLLKKNDSLHKLECYKDLIAIRNYREVYKEGTSGFTDLFWASSRKRGQTKQLLMIQEKTGDPPENDTVSGRSNSILEIRPPPI